MNSSSELIILGSSFIASIPVKCWNFLSVLLRFFFYLFHSFFPQFSSLFLIQLIHDIVFVFFFPSQASTCLFLGRSVGNLYILIILFVNFDVFLVGFVDIDDNVKDFSMLSLVALNFACWAAHINALLVLMPLSLSSIFKYIFKWTMTVCLYSRIYLFYDFTRDHRPLPLS